MREREKPNTHTLFSNEFCYESFSWDITIKKIIYLDKIIRQKDNKFQNILNKIRIGTYY